MRVQTVVVSVITRCNPQHTSFAVQTVHSTLPNPESTSRKIKTKTTLQKVYLNTMCSHVKLASIEETK